MFRHAAADLHNHHSSFGSNLSPLDCDVGARIFRLRQLGLVPVQPRRAVARLVLHRGLQRAAFESPIDHAAASGDRAAGAISVGWDLDPRVCVTGPAFASGCHRDLGHLVQRSLCSSTKQVALLPIHSLYRCRSAIAARDWPLRAAARPVDGASHPPTPREQTRLLSRLRLRFACNAGAVSGMRGRAEMSDRLSRRLLAFWQ